MQPDPRLSPPGLAGRGAIPRSPRRRRPAAQIPAADLGWRDFFADPVAQQLIALSLANNRDLRVAVLNVAGAQAQYESERANLFPAVNADASVLRSSTPGDVLSLPGRQEIRDYSLGASAVSWELDLFGRIRSQASAAHDAYLSDADTQLSTQIALVAQVGSQYLTWLADREALSVSEATAQTQSASLTLIQAKAAHGEATALDVAQAETTVDSANASVDQYTRQVAQDMDELVLLVGTPLPPTLVAQMNAVAGIDSEAGFPALPAGLPADLLERRPDIRAAEHTLMAANDNVGAARAAFFPQVTLTAEGGASSSGLHNLLNAWPETWLVEPQVSVPIFNAGQNFANLDIAKVEKRVEIASYEKTIQSAFRDVSDALAARGTYADQVAAEQALVDADSRYYQLSDMRFKAGIDSYLNVLIAHDALFDAQLTLINLKLAAMQSSITLYKALGGGWQEQTEPEHLASAR